MDVPGVVQSTLGDEQVAAEVPLGSEDTLFVTPTRTIIYRGEGLLSDEAVEEYTHDADRIVVSSGRRKARITLHHDLEGERSFTVPPKRLDDALHPVLAGVLNAAGVTEPGETVKRTFRFSELTVIVTSRRLVKHIGEAVWDQDYEEYHYEDATGLDFEEGSVATQVVLEVDGRRERIKAPNEQAPELRAELEEALFDFYDVSSVEAFERATSPEVEQEQPEAPETPEGEEAISFESGLSPLDTGSPAENSDREPESGTAESTTPTPERSAGQGEESAPGGPGSEPAAETTGSSTGGSADGSTGAPAGSSTAESTGASTDGSAEASRSGTASEAGGSTDGPAAGRSETAARPASEQDERARDGATSANEAAESAAREAAEMARSAADDTAESAGGQSDSGTESAADAVEEAAVSNEELAERLDDLTAAVKHQNELLETHAQTIEQLIEELKRME